MIEAAKRIRTVAIVGNPNAGKTTLFNALTGSHQKVGNYPGVTVERVSGTLKLDGESASCIDIPGLYSLSAVSEDERVAVDAIQGAVEGDSKPDLLVCVLDASNLERNLFLYSQIAELGIPTVVALTMMDRLERKRLSLDRKRLAEMLDVDVVSVVGHKEKGIAELKDAISRNIEQPRIPKLAVGLSEDVESKVESLRERLARIGEDIGLVDLVQMLRESDSAVERYAKDFPEIETEFSDAAEAVRSSESPAEITTQARYAWSNHVATQVVTKPAGPSKRSLSDRIDAILINRVWGFAIFMVVMYLVFQSIYSFAAPLMDGIEWCFAQLGSWISPKLAFSPTLQSLVVEGLIGGVGGMLVFLPQILILFFFIAVLEGTGYLARAAFMMDRLLGWCGLNGRAFIPLLSSFACAIPGIMAARVMPDAKARLATILVAPLMSCSARLPVYLLLIGVFVEPKYGAVWAGIALFAMHMVGLVIAIPIVWILNRKMLRGKRLPFLLELPPYQWPKPKDVWLAMYFRGKVFVKTAGTIIVLMSVLIWAASYFPRSDAAANETKFRTGWIEQGMPDAGKEFEAAMSQFVDEQQLEGSYLGRFGRFLEPAFVPAGFDWRITTSILSAFPAREVVIPSLGIIFSLGAEVDQESPSLQTKLKEATWPDGRPLITIWTAFALMVFFALCCQCNATLAAIKRETNSWKWPVFVFFYMTGLAYIAAVIINQAGLMIGGG
ncbi:MAG: ferrous iron transport protein B [Chlorobia bacterium]|nr:ferrous iron transport protein B [Fimbriimonadaceae bacterium]